MPETVEDLLRERDYATAFERLLPLFESKFLRLATATLGDPGRAQEVTQDVFIKIWRALPTFDGRASVTTWAYAIARNTCLSALRAERYRRTVAIDDAMAAGSEPQFARDVWLHQAIARLPDPQRSVITLFYLEDRSVRDVATALNMSEGTVKSHLHRARRALGDALE